MAILQDWADLIVRWAHIVAGISWIGSSFYFMWLDSSLKPTGDPDVKGENWTVHGGGFYHTKKYLVAPEAMPERLHWFRWESYLTWLSGFVLMGVAYYWSASAFLLDSDSFLTPWQAIAASVASLAAGWIAYDLLCKSPLKTQPAVLFGVLFVFIVGASVFYDWLFSSRAAFLHTGALIATMMTANVAHVIIPNQRKVVAALKAGDAPDPRLGQEAKLRSTHNNYLTLPVIFFMMSNHYPMAYAHPYNWSVVALVLPLGAVARHWFNTHESGGHGLRVAWQWPTAAALTAALIALTAWRPDAARLATADVIAETEAVAIVQIHCAACHAAAPTHESFDAAPGGVLLETADHIRTHSAAVMAQAVLSDIMPLGNETAMTDAERAALGAWLRAGAPGE